MSLIYSIFGVIFPTFFTIFIGYYFRQKDILKKEFTDQGNVLIFNVFMPLYMFIGIYDSSELSSLNLNILGFVLIIEIIIFFLGFKFLQRNSMEEGSKPVMLQAMMRPNLLIFGIALAASFYGERNELGNVILTLGFLAPITNVFAVVGFELFSLKGRVINFPLLIKQVVSNKLILAAIISIIIKISGIDIPKPVISSLKDLSRVTTPLGLLFIGANLNFSKENKERKLVVTSVLYRNIIIPILGLGLAILLGFKGPDLFALIICLSAPVAISSYVMSVIYTGKGDLASRIIMATTLASAPGIFLELLILRGIGLL